MNKHRSLLLVSLFLLVALACQAPATAAQTRPAPEVATTLPSGALIFEDNFSDATSGWDRRAAAEGIMDYSLEGFRILVNAPQTNFWSSTPRDLKNVRVEVDEGKLNGPDENRAGLICRYAKNSYYFFIVTHDGFYAIGMYFDGKTSLLSGTEMQASPLINRGMSVNHLRADCVDNVLTFYVNGQQLAQVKDDTLTHGAVGILAGAFSEPGVDVLFDNFVAIQP